MVVTPTMYNPIHQRSVSDNKINSEGEYAMEDAEDCEPPFQEDKEKTSRSQKRSSKKENKAEVRGTISAEKDQRLRD